MDDPLHYFPETVVGVIYAGGEGTRLWPVSTKDRPKQINTDIMRKTLLEETYERARALFPPERIFIVTTGNIYKDIASIVSLPKENYITQPENADTAIAMGLTAMYLEHLFPNCTAVTFYSDHTISGTRAYYSSIKKAIKLAQEHKKLVTIGTKPLYPSVDFGYIQIGERLSEDSTYMVESFREKPEKEKAQEMVASGEYVWNTGVYVWEVLTLLSLFKAKAPDIYEKLIHLRTSIGKEDEFQTMLETFYKEVRKEAFDKAISEKVEALIVLVSDYNWRDVGNWKTMYELSEKDEDGNAILSHKSSRVITLGTKNSFIIPHQKTVSVVGLEDVIIVQSENELLVCHKSAAHKVKEVAKLANG